ncbi:MAG TPA: efflux transporter outer membrane subunit [Steroidobacteraceae bacterium]|jgi:NodT family efflux transporter outer membrane factor (OMF) lipoprotein|nr:efflux transporter outer membrane subunit [Steroidobacteraceae bacterium]
MRASIREPTIRLLLLALLAGCTVGPKYRPPAAPAATAYKELAASDGDAAADWKPAQPSDDAIRGNWWEVFNDPQLNALEQQVSVSNQNIAASFAAFLQARALVTEARSQYFPTLTTAPSVTRGRQPVASAATRGGATGTTATSPSGLYTDYSLPFDASWTPDLWGRVRNTVKGNVAAAQASAADLQNTRLTAQAEVAVDYYQLRSQDVLKQLLDATVVAYQQSLTLTQALYETGIDDDEAVAQAEVQLQTTQAQATNLGIARAQFEHAIALLVGQPASTFSIAVEPEALKVDLPAIPVGVPSQLLERRPDIAASERLMAQANAQIGVATSAYFPTLTLSAAAGFESSSLATWLTWPSRFWSVGPTLSETLFDAGLRRATVQQYQAAYDQTVASYRQTVLTAFQQVEDNLAALRILSREIQQQDTAVASAERLLAIATDRYQLGLDPYLDVITAQTALLSDRQTAVNLRLQQLTAGVQLIEALGGGWDVSQLPTSKDIASRSARGP